MRLGDENTKKLRDCEIGRLVKTETMRLKKRRDWEIVEDTRRKV